LRGLRYGLSMAGLPIVGILDVFVRNQVDKRSICRSKRVVSDCVPRSDFGPRQSWETALSVRVYPTIRVAKERLVDGVKRRAAETYRGW
jgi:hypothetical protein